MRVMTERRRAVGFVCVQREICSIRGCGRRTMWASEMCEECAAMDREYDRYWSEEEQAKRKRLAYNLCTFAMLAAFVTAMSLLAIEMGPRLYVAFKVWQLGSN